MRDRRGLGASPLALLVLVLSLSCLATASTPADRDPSLAPRRERTTAGELAPDVPISNLDSKSARPDVGTKDAPVDGLDGKPHAGPFVDPLDPPGHNPETARTGHHPNPPARGQPLAEDGVMNDPNRLPPRKGTTGTEGGVTEKDRDRANHESFTGEKMMQKPDPPKVPVAQADREAETDRKSAPLRESATSEKQADTKAEILAGLEKPADLPDKPYNIPHPEPVKAASSGSDTPDHLSHSSLGTVSGDKVRDDVDEDDDYDDDDDDDDDYDTDDDLHDLIPWDSLAGSFSSIAATEIGDKTFIVAALMAMRHSRLQVFTAAFSALFIMTILSGLAGHAVGAIVSKRWSALLAALLFLVFGAKSLQEGLAMSPHQGVSEEIREVEAELEEKEIDMARYANGGRRTSPISPYALEAGRANGRKSRSRTRISIPRRAPSPSSSRSPSPSRPPISKAMAGVKNLFSLLLSPAWVETFSMTFVGELGDRSQIATVAMAAGQEYLWVMVGASLGHFVCTGIAVLGGSVLAGRVSLRQVTLAGGAVFIAFGIFTLVEAIQYWF